MPTILHTWKFQGKEITCFWGCLCELHYGITCFFPQLQKINRKMVCLLLSFVAGTNRFALFFGDSVIFFLWFNLLEFLWIYFTTTTTTTTTKIQAKFDFIILRWINHKTTPLSNRVQYSANTENQIYSTLSIWIYSTLSICSVIIYPSAFTITKSLCYHHRMTIFQNN